MPIKKFKSFEEAEKDLWCFEPDEEYFRRGRAMWDRAEKMRPKLRVAPGVYKYKSIEEANRQMDQWRMEAARRLRDERAEHGATD